MSGSELLKFVESYAAEENVTVWRDLISNLLKLSHTLLNTSFQHELQSFIRRLLKPISKKLGWDPVVGESKYLQNKYKNNLNTIRCNNVTPKQSNSMKVKKSSNILNYGESEIPRV